jgi:hypothetical protein
MSIGMSKRFFFKTSIVHVYLLVVIGAICSSCRCLVTPSYLKDYFDYCYDGAYTGIDTLINIEGYYGSRLMFYKDGTCVNISGIGGRNIQAQFEEMMNNPKKLEAFHRYSNWGCYVICGDTIKIRTVDQPGCGSTDVIWRLEVARFKIIDKNTLERIYPLADKDSFWAPVEFHPLTVRPNSDCSLKKKKWFWCNEEQYKEYKKSLKSRREENKRCYE